MKTAEYQKYMLHFRRPSGTSRGVLHTKKTYFLQITENGKTGLGECALFEGLSADDRPDYEEKLHWLCRNVHLTTEILAHELLEFPSIWIGYEQALQNLQHGKDIYFPSAFTHGQQSIKINGLIWMGDADYMREQIREKLSQKFSCLKLKIGVDWPAEQKILAQLREEFPPEILELRVDANGGFSPENVRAVLDALAHLKVHSIEQPIKAGQVEEMAKLCAEAPLPVALDEELIGIFQTEKKRKLLAEIRPQYIILKASLVGGFSGTDEWISMAENFGIGWWITSALESNTGLNAIAQYTFTKQNPLPQGLGTGQLFTNNTESSLQLNGENLSFYRVT